MNLETKLEMEYVQKEFSKREVKVQRLAEEFIDNIFQHIAHGDAEHREWLKNHLDEWKQPLVNLIKSF